MIPRDPFLDADFLGPETGSKKARHRFRTIWLSDIHLGTTGCQAARLLEFLRATESETLYLVGDIIDGWQLRRRWYWDQIHNNIVQLVLKKAKKGTKVIFVPGNHDEMIRQFIDVDFGGIRIRDELVHTTAQGKRMLVLHGDRFDGVIACAKWLAYVGDSLYTMILKVNQWFNNWRARVGLPYWSLSQYLKLKVKNAVNYISSFEDALADEARKQGLDGVICGHIHKPEIRDINGVLYCNDGDWVESLTALVEDADGTLRIVGWQDIVKHTKKSKKKSGESQGDDHHMHDEQDEHDELMAEHEHAKELEQETSHGSQAEHEPSQPEIVSMASAIHAFHSVE